MKRTKSSQRWLKEHFTDPYVKKAQQQQYRSRAVFKLEQIQQRDKLLKPGMTVIDLGAAPGGWSQIAKKFIGKSGRIIALDILPMEPLEDVVFIQGDFREEEVSTQLLSELNGQRVDVILSDMAPNMSGITSVDQARVIYLAELSVLLCEKALMAGGSLLVKVFQGEGYEAFVKLLRARFAQVLVRKPDASRARSNEIYLLAKSYVV